MEQKLGDQSIFLVHHNKILEIPTYPPDSLNFNDTVKIRISNFSKIKEYNYFLRTGLWSKQVTFALNFVRKNF